MMPLLPSNSENSNPHFIGSQSKITSELQFGVIPRTHTVITLSAVKPLFVVFTCWSCMSDEMLDIFYCNFQEVINGYRSTAY